MKQHPIAILLVFRNQPEEAERMLSQIYTRLEPHYQLYIVDDSSDDNTPQVIESVIAHYGHDDTFFFENPTELGRRRSIKELLQIIEPPIIWIPEDIDAEFQELRTLTSMVREAGSGELGAGSGELGAGSGELGAGSGELGAESGELEWEEVNESREARSLLTDIENVVSETESGEREEDAPEPTIADLFAKNDDTDEDVSESPEDTFISQSVIIADEQHESDQGLNTDTELDVESGDLRNVDKEVDDELNGSKVPAGNKLSQSVINDEDSGEFQEEIDDVQHPKSDAPSDSHPFSRRKPIELPPNASREAYVLFIELKSHIAEQDFASAMRELETAIDKHPNDLDLVCLKINVLQYLGRYVEAAELRHQLKIGKAGKTQPEVRRESILIVDPSDDAEGTFVVDPKTPEPVRNFMNTDVTDKVQEKPFLSPPVVKEFLQGEILAETIIERPVSEVDNMADGSFDMVARGVQHEYEASEEEVQDDSRAVLHDDDSPHTSELDTNDETDEVVESGEPGDGAQEPVDVSKGVDRDELSQSVIMDDSPHASELDTNDETDEVVESGEPGDGGQEPADVSEGVDRDELSQSVIMKSEITERPITPNAPTTTTKHYVPKVTSHSGPPRITIIIPTAITGMPVLERAIESLERYANLPDRDLIVIDNGSLDNTPEFLKKLKREKFMNIRVITNAVNEGFGHAVNQGMKVATGKYVLVMHNDVSLNNDAPGMMADILDDHDDISHIGPIAETVFNEAQRRRAIDPDPSVLKRVPYIDSFFMLIRRETSVRFDERYGLSWFEDMDYGMTDAKKGGQAAIAPGVKVNHLGSYTLSLMGRDPFGRHYWKNASIFETKWNQLPSLPDLDAIPDDIQKLVEISQLINPFYPEAHLLEAVYELMTSELKTRIVTEQHTVSDTLALIRLMMLMDLRDVLRILEERLEIAQIDDFMVHLLMDFYYNHQIYSRCGLYMEKLPLKRQHFRVRLMQLRVHLGARDLDKAAVALSELLNEKPTNPDLFKITSDLYRLKANYYEADEFLQLSTRIDPRR